MAAKRVDPLKAKAAKQKKIAIGGFVVLILVLAVQGPKTLKMLKGPQPAAQAAATTPATTTPAPMTPGTTTPGLPTPAPAAGGAVPGAPEPAAAAAELASVPDSDQAPVVEEGQLATFERFSSKDPFAQQAQPVETPTAKPRPKPTTEPAADPAADPTKSASPTNAGGSGTTSTSATDGGFTTGGTASSPPLLATSTSIAVNGVPEAVTLDTPFPAAQPTFVLVSVATDGKSVEIGVDGGKYADGDATLKLLLGKKITLQNTADGSRYELVLLSIQGFPLPKQKG
jgi:hypothetical protein